MNELVKNSIEARKTAIINAYDVKDQNLINEVNDLFNRINQFGEDSIDSMDFETKFANSSLNKEYIDLFTKIATTCKPKSVEEENNSSKIKSDEEYILEDIVSEAKYQADSITQPIRRELTQEAYDKARDIPVVGEVLNIKQHIDLFSKFKKNKNEDRDEDK